ncbi:MAG: hypothetical protein RIF33_14990 [Cyclobacteriaceae bacterium]
MIRFLQYALFITLLAVCASCENFSWLPKEPSDEPKEEESQLSESREGLVVKKKDGRKISEVTYAEGKKEGRALNYFPSGKEELVLFYKNNLKDGLATTYYESGVVKKESPYVKGKLEGIQKHYFTNGNISAEVPYMNGIQSRKMKEYFKSGKEITKHAHIVVREINRVASNGSFVIKISFSDKVRNAKFYQGALTSGEYFEEAKVSALDTQNGTATITLRPAQGTFIKENLKIIGTYKTNKGLKYITTKVHSINFQGA